MNGIAKSVYVPIMSGLWLIKDRRDVSVELLALLRISTETRTARFIPGGRLTIRLPV